MYSIIMSIHWHQLWLIIYSKLVEMFIIRHTLIACNQGKSKFMLQAIKLISTLFHLCHGYVVYCILLPFMKQNCSCFVILCHILMDGNKTNKKKKKKKNEENSRWIWLQQNYKVYGMAHIYMRMIDENEWRINQQIYNFRSNKYLHNFSNLNFLC